VAVVSGFDSIYTEFIAEWNVGENICTEREGNNRMEEKNKKRFTKYTFHKITLRIPN
jgi:hypothetical protein